MSSNSPSSAGGIGLAGGLFLIFVTLKLCGVIGWSWWWVTAPLWGSVAAFLLFLGAVLGIALVVWFFGHNKSRAGKGAKS